jgi:quinohemoprotein ethanol dehydrogenase
MSYNPQTGLVYIPSRGWDTFPYATDFDFKPDPSRAGGAGQTGLKTNTRGLTMQPAGPAIGPQPLEGGELGTLVAFDPVKQEIRWRVPVGNSRYGGTLSTASNLLFQVAPNGRLIAWSADKGEKLFELPTGLRNGMGPPITFAVDGKQYIALMGGSGGAPSPGRSAEATTPMKPRLLVFGLDGKAQLPQGGAVPASASPSDPHQQDPHQQ